MNVMALGVIEKLREDDQYLIRNLKEELVSMIRLCIDDIGRVDTVIKKDKFGSEYKVQQFVLNDWDQMTREQKSVIKSIQTKPDGSIKVDTYDRMNMIKLLGEFLHAFKNVVTMNIVVQMDFSRTYQHPPTQDS